MACHDHTGLLAHLQTFLPAELITVLARKHGWFERERKLDLVVRAVRGCAHGAALGTNHHISMEGARRVERADGEHLGRSKSVAISTFFDHSFGFAAQMLAYGATGRSVGS